MAPGVFSLKTLRALLGTEDLVFAARAVPAEDREDPLFESW